MPRQWLSRPALRGAVPVLAAGLAIALLPATGAAADGAPTIQEIHGNTFLSPFAGQDVTGVSGIVTAVATRGSARGFWFQDPDPDPGQVGSSGLFVFNGAKTPAVSVGDAVQVSGEVVDFHPDAPASSSVDLAFTEIEHATWTVTSSGNPLPAPVVLTPTTVPTRMAEDVGGGDVENLQLQPRKFAIDFFKSHESELVAVDDARVIGPTDSFGELYVTDKPNVDRTPRGGMIFPSYADRDTGRIEVVTVPGGPAGPAPIANVGDKLVGRTVGPLAYSEFGGYEIEATSVGTLTSGGIQPVVAKAQSARQLAIATYNVENLAATDPQAKFDALAKGVVTNLASPDILAVEEVQDNDGETDDGVVVADQTLTKLTDAIATAGGPRYQWQAIDPVNDADGGAPGGNIRQVFLFNPARVSFVDIPGGTATTPVSVVNDHGVPQLSASPGRIDPNNLPAWQASRKPLAGEFLFQGRFVFVVANHFVAKLADQPDEGRFQPPARASESQRDLQAQEVSGFVRSVQKIDGAANVVVLGDLNDYQFSQTAKFLTAKDSLTDLIDTLPADQQYTYDFDGQSEVLDHILIDPAIHRFQYQVVHINAEFANQTSDHDPQVVRIVPAGR
ncbi:MAG TPA: endonuclease/exonuclease/phosphatase family protein [Pseudonocardiaceae bacterium]|nr:endonuclease/exonuclease/phosphatase family protein [Pseudonocardiaceae bacterium]